MTLNKTDKPIKPKKCPSCKEIFTPIQYPGSTMKTKICMECASSKQKKAADMKYKKKLAEKKREFNKKTKELKESIKTYNEWMSEAQAAFNKYIRLRDHFDPCITCMRSKEAVEIEDHYMTKGFWDAGHYKSRGAKGHLRFHLWNVHKQCKSCNAGHANWRDTETVSKSYEANLIKKIGNDRVDFLNNNNDIKSFDIDYLKRVKSIFTRKARKLEKKLK